MESKEEKNQNLPVPKLKVGADGEVVLDMDSLVSDYSAFISYAMKLRICISYVIFQGYRTNWCIGGQKRSC